MIAATAAAAEKRAGQAAGAAAFTPPPPERHVAKVSFFIGDGDVVPRLNTAGSARHLRRHGAERHRYD
jgi:hypothetical protein